jgi:hypothetical protein
MDLDIHASLDVIPIQPYIGYHDLYHIAKYMNVQYIGGNVLVFPINSQWIKYFDDHNINKYSLERTAGRHILFIFDGENNLIGFNTDISWHNGSVLLNSEVNKIQECIAKLHFINNTQSPSYNLFKDPITMELLNQPYTASDGFTYSAITLYNLFNPKPEPDNYIPRSPITREPLVILNREYTLEDKYGRYGIRNKFIQMLISKLFEDKLTIMEGGNKRNNKRKSKKNSFKK